MRSTIIESVEGKFRINLGSSAMLVGTVQDYGKAIGDLEYEARLTGKEVRKFLEDAQCPDLLDDVLVDEHHYILTAFDD